MIASVAGAFASGIVGGAILPLMTAGGMAGVAISAAFPAIPPALCVAGMMAALPSAMMPVSIFLSVVAMLITGLPVAEAIPVFVTALTTSAVAGIFKPTPGDAQ